MSQLNPRLFTFGQYKGRSILSIIELNPSYVEWCLDNIKGFKLSEAEEIQLAIMDSYKTSQWCDDGWQDYVPDDLNEYYEAEW